MITKLVSTQVDFQKRLSSLLAWDSVSNKQVTQTVDDIIAKIRSNGDSALVDYTNTFDEMNATSMKELTIKLPALKQAFLVIISFSQYCKSKI
jgi:histidinol dehydrogenase